MGYEIAVRNACFRKNTIHNAETVGEMAGVRVDDLDRALIAQLSADARVTMATLARRLKVARSTVQARIERLEATGAIAGYTVRLGDGITRSRIRASVLVSLEPRALPQVLTRLRALPEVERIHTTSGRFDLIVQMAALSTGDLEAAIDTLGATPGLRATETLVHLSTRLDRAL